MGHACCKHPDGGHLLRLVIFGLIGLLHGHVPFGNEKVSYLSFFVEQGGSGHLKVDLFPVMFLRSLGAVPAGPVFSTKHLVAVSAFRGLDFVEVEKELVYGLNASIGRDQGQDVRDSVQNGLDLLLFGLQGRIGFLKLRYFLLNFPEKTEFGVLETDQGVQLGLIVHSQTSSHTASISSAVASLGLVSRQASWTAISHTWGSC